MTGDHERQKGLVDWMKNAKGVYFLKKSLHLFCYFLSLSVWQLTRSTAGLNKGNNKNHQNKIKMKNENGEVVKCDEC